jgi:hypothetical protein
MERVKGKKRAGGGGGFGEGGIRGRVSEHHLLSELDFPRACGRTINSTPSCNPRTLQNIASSLSLKGLRHEMIIFLVVFEITLLLSLYALMVFKDL